MATSSSARAVPAPVRNASIQYKNPEGSYIAERVAALIPDADPEGLIAGYNKDDAFRDDAGYRAEGAEAARGESRVEDSPFTAREIARAEAVTDEARDQSKRQNAAPLNPDIDAVEAATDKVLLRKETITAAKVFGTTWCGVSGGEDVAGLWAPKGETNTFLADVKAAMATVFARTGKWPTTLAMDFNTMQKVSEAEEVLDKIKYTQKGVLTADLLASILNLREVVVGSASFSVGKERKDGTTSASGFKQIWEKNATKGSAFLCYRPAAPTLKTAMTLAMPRVNFAGPNGGPRRVLSWREESRHSDVYEVAEKFDVMIPNGASDLGYLFVDTIVT